MLKTKKQKQSKLEMVAIEQLVPKDHLLRKIDRAIDFSFIRKTVAHLYCPDNGRPALDPEVFFKMLFIGYFFGIRSERQLVREVEVNMAYRWFLGFSITEKIPEASIFSQNRRRRFSDSTIFQEIFDEIVMQAIKRKMVDGKTLYTDSTHLKASANKNKSTKILVEKSRAAYLDDLDKAVNEDREAHGKKPLKKPVAKCDIKLKKCSTTDPDSGFMMRDKKPQGFFYLDHRTVDGLANIIVDSHVTAGNVNDATPYLDRLDRVRKSFDFDVEAVGLDAGYDSPFICKGLEDRQIDGVIAYRRPSHKKGYLYKSQFDYLKGLDCYYCPAGHALKYRTTNRDGYREYKSDPKVCRTCKLLENCTKSKDQTKIITRHVYEDCRDRFRERRLSDYGKLIYQRRKETVERSFADGKELHGQRYVRMRGLVRASEQCLLAAACQNMKKIALAVFLCRFWQPSSEFFRIRSLKTALQMS